MFSQKFLTQLKSRILTIKIVVTFFVEEPIFLCQGETGSYIFRDSIAILQPVGS